MLDGYGFLHLGFVDTWPIRSRTEDRVRVHMVVRMQAGARVVGFGLYLPLAELPGPPTAPVRQSSGCRRCRSRLRAWADQFYEATHRVR
jgi:hypothetical protein